MRAIKPLYAGVMLGAVTLIMGVAASLAGAPQARGQASGRAVATADVQGAGAAAREALWKAVAASGRVEALESGRPADAAWDRIRRGDRVKPLSALRTFRRSRTTMTRLGDVILVDPETELTLPAGSGMGVRTIRQSTGNALYEIDPSAGEPLNVETPYLVAGVKGTVFSVIVDRNYSSVSVIAGEVEVRSLATGESVDLLAGETVVFDGDRRELEVYRESRNEARGRGSEVSDSARASLRKTGSLLETASGELSSSSVEDDSWTQLRSLDLSLWEGDRDLVRSDLDDSVNDVKGILTNEEDGRLIKQGLKRP